MPYKSEQIPIAGTEYDKRRKLTDDHKKAVLILAESGYSQRQLARMFGCSRRLIQSILHPQLPKRRSVKYSRKYQTQKKREYRQRKQKLFLEGKIENKESKSKK